MWIGKSISGKNGRIVGDFFTTGFFGLLKKDKSFKLASRLTIYASGGTYRARTCDLTDVNRTL